jgi:hypothetical protein
MLIFGMPLYDTQNVLKLSDSRQSLVMNDIGLNLI